MYYIYVVRLYIYGHNTIVVEVKSYFRLFFEEVFFDVIFPFCVCNMLI